LQAVEKGETTGDRLEL
jgi:hypothetical protein